MKVVFIIIILLIALFVIYRIIKSSLQNKKLKEQRFERVEELYRKLEKGEKITQQDILPFAENVLTRQTTFQLLNEYKKTYLFPDSYYSITKAAETNLANWLEWPTELDACPDEIEHVKRISFDFDGQNNFVHYEVFKYRVNEPHWAAKNGWDLGVVGPYFDDSKPYDFPQSTFSRIGSKSTPEEEAKWVHENLTLRKKRLA